MARRTDTTAVIIWSTDEPSNSLVEYGTTTAYGLVQSRAENETVHVVTLTGLTGSTTYNFRVGSMDVAGNGPTFSGNSSFSTDPTPDTTPPRITRLPGVLFKTDSTAVIAWGTDEPSNSIVEYGTTTAYTLTQTIAENVAGHRVTLTDLGSSTAYNFRVGSRDVFGNGPTLSRNFSFTTDPVPDTIPPRIVRGPLVTNASTDRAEVIWETDEPGNTVVEYADQVGATFGVTKTLSLAENVTSHSLALTNLSADTPYRYRVGTTDAAGNGPTFSSPRFFRTLPTPDTTPPIITEGPLVAYRGHDRMTLIWRTDEPANSTVIYSQRGQRRPSTVFDGRYDTFHYMQIRNLTRGTTYDLVVESRDPSGNLVRVGDITRVMSLGVGNKESGVLRVARAVDQVGPAAVFAGILAFETAETPDTTLPTITVGPRVAYKSDITAIIEWTTDEAADSNVEYTLAQSGAQVGPAAVFAGILALTSDLTFSTDHSIRLTNLSPNTTYVYRVASTDPSGNGPTQSAQFSFTTDPAVDIKAPQIVAGPAAAATDTTATIEWTTDEPSDSLVQYREESAQSDLTRGDINHITKHSITLTNLKPNTTYRYRVASMDPSGNGPTTSSDVLFTTKATESQTILFFPHLAAGRLWNIGVQVDNLDTTSPAAIRITYRKNDGTIRAIQEDTIAAGQSRTYFGDGLLVGPTFTGSAVVDSNRRIAVAVNQLVDEPKAASSYGGIPATSATVNLPLIMRKNAGYDTWIHVFNAGNVPASNLKVSFYRAGTLVATKAPSASLAPGAVFELAQGEMAELTPTPWVGSAQVTSDQPVSVLVNQFNGRQLLSYIGFGRGSTKLYAPLVMTANNGYFAGIQVQNVGVASTVATLKVYDASGTIVKSEERTIPAGGSQTWFPVTPEDTRFVGSATVEVPTGGEIVGIVNQINSSLNRGSSYSMFTGGTSTVIAPLIQTANYGWYTGFQVQNIGSQVATVSLKIGGSTADTVTIQPGSAKTWFPVTPADVRFVGSATAEGASGSSLVGVVNQLNDTQGAVDYFTTYEAMAP